MPSDAKRPRFVGTGFRLPHSFVWLRRCESPVDLVEALTGVSTTTILPNSTLPDRDTVTIRVTVLLDEHFGSWDTWRIGSDMNRQGGFYFLSTKRYDRLHRQNLHVWTSNATDREDGRDQQHNDLRMRVGNALDEVKRRHSIHWTGKGERTLWNIPNSLSATSGDIHNLENAPTAKS